MFCVLVLLINCVFALEQQVTPTLTLTRKAILNANLSTPHSVAWGAAGAADGNDAIYVCGGRNATVVSNACAVFFPNNCMKQSTPCRLQYTLKQARFAFGSTRAFDRFYVIGGSTSARNNQSFTNSTEWLDRHGRSDGGSLSVARAFPLVLGTRFRVIVVGGIGAAGEVGAVDVLRVRGSNATEPTWAHASSLRVPRGEACGAILTVRHNNGTVTDLVYVVGGRVAQLFQAYSTIEVIDSNDAVLPARAGLELSEARYGCAAIVLPAASAVLVVGGIGVRQGVGQALFSIERIGADGVVTTAASRLDTPRSHMTGECYDADVVRVIDVFV
jgi:hypothetical protein